MTLAQATAFLLFAVVAAITPGPSNVMLTATGAAVGVRRGLPALVGQVSGMGLIVFLVSFGFGSLVLRSPLLLQTLKWCSIGFLLWLAWQLATAGRSESPTERVQVGFWRAAGFQWINPKSWLIAAGTAGTYFQAGAGGALGQAGVLALLFMVAAFPSCFVWLVAGASLRRLLRTERASRIFNVTMGLLLAGSILLFIR